MFLGRRSQAKPRFSVICLILFFYGSLAVFGSISDSTFDDVLHLSHHFPEHKFCRVLFMDVGILFGLMFDGLLVPSPFAHPPWKTLKQIDCMKKLHGLKLQKTISHNSPHLY